MPNIMTDPVSSAPGRSSQDHPKSSRPDGPSSEQVADNSASQPRLPSQQSDSANNSGSENANTLSRTGSLSQTGAASAGDGQTGNSLSTSRKDGNNINPTPNFANDRPTGMIQEVHRNRENVNPSPQRLPPSPKQSTRSRDRNGSQDEQAEQSTSVAGPSSTVVSRSKISNPLPAKKLGRLWFNCDPSGITLVVCTWLLLGFASFVTNYYILLYWFKGTNWLSPEIELSNAGLGLGAFYWFLFVMTFAAHVLTMFTHPGIVDGWDPPPERTEAAINAAIAEAEASNQFESEEEAIQSLSLPPPVRWCKVCEQHKPDRAHHCKVCNLCVFRMDHHCPWVNNCVGFNNQRLFILFLVYVAALSIFTMLLELYVIYLYATSESQIQFSNLSLFLGILLAGQSGFFLFFVGDFLFEQIEAIETNATLVETYQQKHGRKLGLMAQLYEVMGQRMVLWWLPMGNPNPPDYLEPVYLDKNATPDGDVMDHDDIGIVSSSEEGEYSDDEPSPRPHYANDHGPNENYGGGQNQAQGHFDQNNLPQLRRRLPDEPGEIEMRERPAQD